jgi:hypothetical protein
MSIAKKDDKLRKIYYDLGECTLKDYTVGLEKCKIYKPWFSNNKTLLEFVGIIKRLVHFVYFLSDYGIYHSDFKPENIALKKIDKLSKKKSN